MGPASAVQGEEIVNQRGAIRDDLVGAGRLVDVIEASKGPVVEEHSHPHEQVGMLLEGRAIFTIGITGRFRAEKRPTWPESGNARSRGGPCGASWNTRDA